MADFRLGFWSLGGDERVYIFFLEKSAKLFVFKLILPNSWADR